MRTDHVSALLIHEWLVENAPDLAAQWKFRVDDERVKGVVQMLKQLIPGAILEAATQHYLARLAIGLWNLTDVALLGAGLPTPLSPRPDQLRYFTDLSPDAVAEAAAMGYNALQVNAADPEHLKQLNGATTAVAAGLFALLSDEATKMVFDGLASAGFHTLIFNQTNPEMDYEVTRNYAKLGIKGYPRSVEQVKAVIPENWKVELAVPLREIMIQDVRFGARFAKLSRVNDVYKCVRV